MANIVVVGLQWGDEGKGKIVDLLCPAFDAVVRDVVTDRITNATGPDLIERKGRAELKHAIKESIEKHTDVKVEEVLFTDVAVQ